MKVEDIPSTSQPRTPAAIIKVMLKKLVAFGLPLFGLVAYLSAQAGPSWLDSYRPAADRLIKESQSNDFAWQQARGSHGHVRSEDFRIRGARAGD